MVLRHKMSSEQPVKKKLKIHEDDETTEEKDEIDFTLSGTANLANLALSLPTGDYVNAESDDLRRMCNLRAQVLENCKSNANAASTSSACKFVESIPSTALALTQIHTDNEMRQTHTTTTNELYAFEEALLTHCLCTFDDSLLHTILDANALHACNRERIVQFLSTLQLLFDVYLKQNQRARLCAKILDICTYVTRTDTRIFEQIAELEQRNDPIITHLSVKVLAALFIIAKAHAETTCVTMIVNSLVTDNDRQINFSLDVIKRILDWKDIDVHVLEDNVIETSGNCTTVTLTDPDTFDTSPIKTILINQLEEKWPHLLDSVEEKFANLTPQTERCVVNFFSLWENIISVRANLSVIDTKSFYTHLDKFMCLLNVNLSPAVWRQLLSLFNEVLCYGSTLALQDMLPEETCALAHLIVRCVKDYRLLDALPFKRAVNALIGADAGGTTAIDRTLLQKKVLLVLKSIAITVKETRSDSSDSSVGSDDFDFNQDMQLIERSIRDVLKKLDSFLKQSLQFHPESEFTKMVIHLFSDQDDYMIESMVCMLDITVGICYRNSVFPDLLAMLNPGNNFIEFLKAVSYDSDVLLDYLVSNETCFLLYLLRFLKFLRKDWRGFVHACERASVGTNARMDSALDNVMAVLIRLRLQINRLVSKQMFPYNIGPVLRLLDNCENLYEGNDFS